VSFGSADDRGKSVDCIKIFQEYGATTDDVVYGLYHRLDAAGKVFDIHLAKSRVGQLNRWQHLTVIDDNASQPAVWVNPDGSFLVAWERTETPEGNYIRIRHYKSMADLSKGVFSAEHDMLRTLSKDCEGTPSFESVQINGGLQNSVIKLRFHYFEDSIRD
jgi:hypothetical protein